MSRKHARDAPPCRLEGRDGNRFEMHNNEQHGRRVLTVWPWQGLLAKKGVSSSFLASARCTFNFLNSACRQQHSQSCLWSTNNCQETLDGRPRKVHVVQLYNSEHCCAVLIHAVLCCIVPFSAVLNCAVHCCAVLCCAVLCCAALRCAALRCAAPPLYHCTRHNKSVCRQDRSPMSIAAGALC